MKTSVGIHATTRDRLRALKPEDMGWDAFLGVLVRAADPSRLQELIEAEQWIGEAEAADVARQRYFHYRRRKQELLTADELRERVHLRRISLRLTDAIGTLRSASQSGHLQRDRILPMLESMDEDIHRAKDLLSH